MALLLKPLTQNPRTDGDARPPLVELTGVVKHYHSTVALRGVDLTVCAPATIALLGPNGAGKSTLLSILAGLVRPSSGTASVCGSVGVLTHKTMLYDSLTGRENLALHADLRGLDRSIVGTRLEQVGLSSAADRFAGEYSHGMRKRLSLARAMLHDPAVLVLDEPFAGLDLESQERLSQTLQRLRGTCTVILSTHDTARAFALADRLVILVGGRLVWDQPRSALASAEALVRAYGRLVQSAHDTRCTD